MIKKYIRKKIDKSFFLSDSNEYSTVDIKKSQLSLVSCSNVIYKIEDDGEVGYFCECRKMTSLHKFVFDFVNDYFSIFNIDNDKELVLNSLMDSTNFSKFVNIGTGTHGLNSNYFDYFSGADLEVIGIELPIHSDKEQIKRIKRFVERYAWPSLNAYYDNPDVPNGQYYAKTPSKVLATEAVAKLLGLEKMIPHSEYKYLKIDDSTDASKSVILFGNYMESALGISGLDVPADKRLQMITSSFQKDLSNLNYLDVISHEKDHSPNNYNVVIDNDMAVGISAFDNNGSGTFSSRSDIDFVSFKNCSSIINSNGTINRPFIDSGFASKLFNITWHDLRKQLRPYLFRIPIFFTWIRILKLRKAIDKTIKTRKDFIVSENMLNNAILQEELSGKYGKTYLISFLNECVTREKYSYEE